MTFDQIQSAINSAFRDYVVQGLPASGAQEPVKSEVRAALALLVAAIDDGGFTAPPDWAADLAAVVAQLEDVDAAVSTTAADRAATSADRALAVTARDEATAARADAVAAAAATGPTFWFDTKAAATAGLAGITANAVVEIFADESQGGHLTRYRKEGGVLVFKVDLTKPFYLDQIVTLTADTDFGRVEFGPNGQIVTGAFDADILEVVDTRRVGVFDVSGGGAVTISRGDVRPEWWGDIEDSIELAIQALPGTDARTIRLSSRRYQQNPSWFYGTGGSPGYYISRENLTIEGERKPRFANDCRSLSDGSIVEGLFLPFANRATFRRFGVDAGADWCDDVNSGAASDAFVCTFPSDVAKAADAVVYKNHFEDIIGLAKAPDSAVHAVILAEAATDSTWTGEITGMYGVHGVVIKATQIRGGSIAAYANDAEGVILKTDDQATAVCSSVQIDKITVGAAPPGTTPYATSSNINATGLMLNPEGGSIDIVQIGEYICIGRPYGVLTDISSGNTLSNLQIGILTIEDASVGGIVLSAIAGAAIERCSIGQAIVRNTPVGLYAIWSNAGTVHVGLLHVVNADVAVEALGAGALAIDTLIAENCTDGALRLHGVARPTFGKIIMLGTTPGVFATTAGASDPGQAPVLAGTWDDYDAAQTPFAVTYAAGEVVLEGEVTPNGTSNLVTTLPFALRPQTHKTFVCLGTNGTTQVGVPVSILSNGQVLVNPVIASDTTNCTTKLSLGGARWRLEG